MNRKILTIPKDNKELRQTSREVTTFDTNLESLVDDLSETLLSQTDPPGLGLSAPQIGVLKRVFVAMVRNKPKAFINPKILKFSGKEVALLEGCFSVPLLYGHVVRPAEIELTSQDKKGKGFQAKYKGLPARIIQHEIDHLNGVLFTDHIHDQNGKLFEVKKDKKGKEHLVEVAFA